MDTSRIWAEAFFMTLDNVLHGIAIVLVLALGYVAVTTAVRFHRAGMARVAAQKAREAHAARPHLHLVK